MEDVLVAVVLLWLVVSVLRCIPPGRRLLFLLLRLELTGASPSLAVDLVLLLSFGRLPPSSMLLLFDYPPRTMIRRTVRLFLRFG